MKEPKPKLPQSQVRLRPVTDSDLPFVFHSWLRSYRMSEFAKELHNQVYFPQHHKVIEGLLQRCGGVVACDPLDSTQLYGYVVAEVIDECPVVHYCYIKEPFRKMGVAHLLLTAANVGWKPDAAFCYTHKTYQSTRLEKRYPMVFHPYLAWYAYEAAGGVKKGPQPEVAAEAKDADE